MNKVQLMLTTLSVVVLLSGLFIITTEPAVAGPACCHCLCNCNQPNENIACYVPIYNMQNCTACGSTPTTCGSGFGDFCQW